MQVNLRQAMDIIRKQLPGAKIEAQITYQNFYIFRVLRNEPGEENFDPFYSVDQRTGEFRDFSILTDGVGSEVVKLFDKVMTT